MKDLVTTVLATAAIVAVVILLAVRAVPPRDNSDRADERSGMTIFHDELSGCEYLGRGYAGLTPRIGRDGKQVCNP